MNNTAKRIAVTASLSCVLFAGLSLTSSVTYAQKTGGTWTDPNDESLPDDFKVQGEYVGKVLEGDKLGCQVIVSAACLDIAGFDPSAYANRAVDVRGRAGDIVVCTFTDASGLPTVETVAS